MLEKKDALRAQGCQVQLKVSADIIFPDGEQLQFDKTA